MYGSIVAIEQNVINIYTGCISNKHNLHMKDSSLMLFWNGVHRVAYKQAEAGIMDKSVATHIKHPRG